MDTSNSFEETKNGNGDLESTTTVKNNIVNEDKETIKTNGNNGKMNGRLNSTPQWNAALLSMPCRNLDQLKQVVPLLIDHTILSAEERISKRLTTKYKVSV